MSYSTGAQLQAAISALPNSPGKFVAFDPFFYGTQYMAAYSGSLSPIDHFAQIGASRGYKPNATFDPVYYAGKYADVNGKGFDSADLLVHFLKFGLDEGRAPNATYATFDSAAYLAANADVASYVNANIAQFGGSTSNGALSHYIKFGSFEGRSLGSVNTITLTTGLDTLTGTAAADTFISNVVQNSLGAQVNTLGSGDTLAGGSGVDTLNAKITAGAFIGGTSSMPIQPQTSSIEVVKLQAVSSGVSFTDTSINDTQVYVNAKDMSGVTKLSSNHSDADLIIQNMTTQGLVKLSDMTIGMEYSGNKDSRWGASDMKVYFDQDYLTPQATSTSPSIEFLAMNEDNYDATVGAKPLDGVFFRQLQFTLNGVTHDLKRYLGEPENGGNGSDITTYAQFLTALKAALVKLKEANPANIPLQSVVATLGDKFKTDVDPLTLVQREGTAMRLSVDGLTNGVANTLKVLSTDLEVARAANATVPNNNRYELASDTAPVAGTVLAINVALEKVGLAGDGGELIIGSMNKASGNEWNAVKTVTNTTSGIKQFDVTVYGANDKSSSLAGMHSTNDNLRVVNVVTDAALAGTSFANLTIGNSNTTGIATRDPVNTPSSSNANALKDVQTFNAAGLKGDLTLYAALTESVTAKYLNVGDVAANATADNVNFAYTSGSGNDYINLYLDPANLAKPGTVSREDMTLTINTGLGNDQVVVSTGVGAPATNWYVNQHITANLKMVGGVATGQLQINTGDGLDTVRTLGSGDYAINAGEGNDTVYADNTGTKAAWVVNATNTALTNLASQTAVAPAAKIANLKLNVSFKGYDAEVNVGGSNGSLTGVSVTDLTINQAIKDAINNNDVLKKLLIAADGPGRTLVITSLIDGVQSELNTINDVVISLSSTALTAGQAVNAVQLSGLQAQALGFGTGVNALTFASNLNGRFDTKTGTAGTASLATSDNLIVGGTGDDVIVLGTGTDSNDTVGYAGFGNGTDTIVNFNTTFNAANTTVAAAPAPGVKEVVTVTFGASDGNPTSQTIIFDGSTVTLATGNGAQGVVPAADVAQQFATQFGGANWVATHTPGSAVVTLTALAAGAVTDVVATDFTGSYITAGGATAVATPVTTVQGSAGGVLATSSVFVVDFTEGSTAAIAAGTFVFNGTTVNYDLGDGALTLASKLGAATYADWTTVTNLANGTVTFTAKVPGVLAIPADTVFKVDAASNADGIIGTIATTTTGAAASGNITPATIIPAGPGAGFDYIDFSSYGAKAVYDGATLVQGVAATLGQTYITLVESTTNAGSYTMTQYTEAGVTDTVVGVIGVADFGAHQAFVAANFVIA